MVPTFEYCAARFLDHWVRNEDRHVRALRQPTTSAIRSSLAYFKVSRGFTGIEENPNVASTVQELILVHSRQLTARTSIARVEELATAFQNELKLDNLLSAASKLLWLRCQSPVVIYDSRAVRALKRLGHPLKQRAYGPYHDAWQETFEEHRNEIAAAASALPSISRFTAAAGRSKAQIDQLVNNAWFLERVLDQYLWIVGEPKKGEEQTYDD